MRQGNGRMSFSGRRIGGRSEAEEGEEAEVAEDLELLADFVADGAKGRGKGQKPQRSKPKAAAPGCEFTARRVAWYATSIRAPRAQAKPKRLQGPFSRYRNCFR